MFKRIGIGLAAVGTAAAATGAYLRFIRPWMLTWGSTEEERARPLPGDDLVLNPTHITTRAITIDSPLHEIWPWLVQMGQDRAGFYTHNWVERLLLRLARRSKPLFTTAVAPWCLEPGVPS